MAKRILIIRLSQNLVIHVDVQGININCSGIVFDILQVIRKYVLWNYIEQFLGDDRFPSEKRWKDFVLVAGAKRRF